MILRGSRAGLTESAWDRESYLFASANNHTKPREVSRKAYLTPLLLLQAQGAPHEVDLSKGHRSNHRKFGRSLVRIAHKPAFEHWADSDSIVHAPVGVEPPAIQNPQSALTIIPNAYLRAP